MKSIETYRHSWPVDRYNANRMGLYLTNAEGQFIENAFGRYGFPGNLLDIGAGSGRFAVPLYRKGIRVIALDNNLLPLQRLCKKESEIDSIVADASHHLPFKDATFDCLLCIELPIIEAPTRHSFLKECHRILNHKGLLLFTGANKTSYKGFIKNKIRKNDKWRYFSSYRQTVRELYEVGLRLKSAKGFNWVPGSRGTDNKFVAFFAYLEKTLNLHKLPILSPWVLFTVEKP